MYLYPVHSSCRQLYMQFVDMESRHIVGSIENCEGEKEWDGVGWGRVITEPLEEIQPLISHLS